MLLYRTQLAGRARENSSPGTELKIWMTTIGIWIYCNPLRSPKTTKTLLGKAWHWNHISLENLGKSLELARQRRRHGA
jgi:hypothetical protein